MSRLTGTGSRSSFEPLDWLLVVVVRTPLIVPGLFGTRGPTVWSLSSASLLILLVVCLPHVPLTRHARPRIKGRPRVYLTWGLGALRRRRVTHLLTRVRKRIAVER